MEKRSPKYDKLKNALPLGGVKFILNPFWKMMITAPKIISRTDTNLTVMVMTCIGLVFDILLKEKSAPERKKSMSQN